MGQVEEKREPMSEDMNENSNSNSENPITIKAEVCICNLHILTHTQYISWGIYEIFLILFQVRAAGVKKKMLGELPRRKSNLAVDVTTYRTLDQYERVEDHLKSMSNET